LVQALVFSFPVIARIGWMVELGFLCGVETDGPADRYTPSLLLWCWAGVGGSLKAWAFAYLLGGAHRPYIELRCMQYLSRKRDPV
jgi:hypothetical protein